MVAMTLIVSIGMGCWIRAFIKDELDRRVREREELKAGKGITRNQYSRSALARAYGLK